MTEGTILESRLISLDPPSPQRKGLSVVGGGAGGDAGVGGSKSIHGGGTPFRHEEVRLRLDGRPNLVSSLGPSLTKISGDTMQPLHPSSQTNTKIFLVRKDFFS